jgi:MFS family permease
VLLGLLLLSALSASIVTTVNFYTQLYFSGIGFTLAAIGLIFATSRVTDSAFTAVAPRIIRRLPPRVLLPIFVGAEALGLLAMSTSQPLVGLLGFLVFFHSADAVLYPAISTYLNQRSPEAQRALVLSLDTGLFSAAMIVLFPLFGLGLTHVPYATAYAWVVVALVAGGFLILGGTRLLLRLRAKRRE